MDIFIEKIVAKKKSIGDIIYITSIILAGILLELLILAIPYIQFFALTLFLIIIFLVYYLISLRNIEYEYAFTDGILDIDKIINKKKRKRLVTFSCHDIEIVASIKNKKHIDKINNIKKKFFAISSRNSQDVYFVISGGGIDKMVLFFEPDQRMLDAIKTKIPRKVAQEL